ncbi:unnamed protein product [Oncorhynchus mykiss]|uniref:RNA helicase n=1 Tax=Oncorhynchus mykiss TaxID=8022 RepID=A0A060WV58_ONCMY|nr:unnamed protein product [Oncorhynchus mykiss]
MADIKNFLYAWCGKKKLTPSYDIRAAGNKNRQKFLCEVRIDRFNYTGMGNSTNKKDSQANAARDLVNYLVGAGEMNAAEVQALGVSVPDFSEPSCGGAGGDKGNVGFGSLPPSAPHLVVKAEQANAPSGPFPGVTGLGYSGGAGNSNAPWDRGANLNDYYSKRDEQEAQATLESEEVDLNAGLHGNWTLENAKARLNQFFQKEKNQTDYKYSQVGPDHNRSFIAEMQLFVRQLEIIAREHGSNKKLAAQSSALSIVRQLYHLGVIEPHTGMTKKKEGEILEAFEVNVVDDLQHQLKSIAQELGVVIPPPVSLIYMITFINLYTVLYVIDLSMTLNMRIELNILPVSRHLIQGRWLCLSPPRDKPWPGWCPGPPPQVNWNPWTSSNIDEGPLAFVRQTYLPSHLKCTPEQISADLQHELTCQLEQDQSFLKVLLPVKNFERGNMSAVQGNSVVIIRGATGCGKTTQVPQYILDQFIKSGRASDCNIIVTQPRRISAVSVAERVSYERGENVGKSCGYSVRFESILPRPHASIMFCTLIQPGCKHCRSRAVPDKIKSWSTKSETFLVKCLNVYFSIYRHILCVLIKSTVCTVFYGLVMDRSKVFLAKFQSFPEYFLEDCIQLTHFIPPPNDRKRKEEMKRLPFHLTTANCNVICGPAFTPETKRSMAQMNEKETPFGLVEALLKYIEALQVAGACLRKVFRPIYFFHVLFRYNLTLKLLRLWDFISVVRNVQQKVTLFTSHNNMTNYAMVWGSVFICVAEHALTMKNVCLCFCAYPFLHSRLETHMTPEIFRTPLHEVALSIKLLRLGSIGHFLSKAIEPPPLDAVIEAEHTLRELDALDTNDELTPLGRILAKLLIEPRLGKMMIMRCIFKNGFSMFGDAVCTISAASCFPEPFINDGKRLRYVHRNFAGTRFSDHVALLSVFQAWDENLEVRMRSADSVNTKLNMSTLRMTWEAKVQLKESLINSGFPEECLMTQMFNNVGPDRNLDVVISLLTYGSYPNVCYHKEKRKILTTEGRNALIHKCSINCPFSSQDMTYPSPFFVFSEKIRTRMTLVSPLQLILFAAKKITSNGEIIELDDWIKLKIPHDVAGCIAALRAGMEALVVEVIKDPEYIRQLDPTNERMLNIIRQISKPSASGLNLKVNNLHFGVGPRPPKMGRFDGSGGGVQRRRNTETVGVWETERRVRECKEENSKKKKTHL